VNVGNMYGSSIIQQGTSGSVAKITFSMNDPRILDIVADLRKVFEHFNPKEPTREQMGADISTIEAQIRSPHPKPSIITKCLHSARTILEGTAGSLLAAGVSAHLLRNPRESSSVSETVMRPSVIKLPRFLPREPENRFKYFCLG
jgi:hypothetical protein